MNVGKWVNEAPITVFTSSSDEQQCKLYAANLKAYVEDWQKGTSINYDLPAKQQTIVNAIRMCRIIGMTQLKLSETRVFFAYLYGGEPIGLMLLEIYDHYSKLDDVVTHPGAPGGGPIMIEFALNYIKSKRKAQLIDLWALDEHCKGPYLGMGFKPEGGGLGMRLDPAKSDKWVLVKKKWAYKSTSNAGPLYAARDSD